MKKQTIGLYRDTTIVKKYYSAVKRNGGGEGDGIDANVFRSLKASLRGKLYNKRVIDLGCGDGRWGDYVINKGAKQVVCLDQSPEMMKRVSERKSAYGLSKLIATEGDMRKIPSKINSYDVALSVFSMMYFENLDQLAIEITRILRAGGVLVITTNIMRPINKVGARLINRPVLLQLGVGGHSIEVKNLFQTETMFESAFMKAGLKMQRKKIFKPEGVQVSSKFKSKKDFQLKKALYVFKKI